MPGVIVVLGMLDLGPPAVRHGESPRACSIFVATRACAIHDGVVASPVGVIFCAILRPDAVAPELPRLRHGRRRGGVSEAPRIVTPGS